MQHFNKCYVFLRGPLFYLVEKRTNSVSKPGSGFFENMLINLISNQLLIWH
jgi:hypothetical protein